MLKHPSAICVQRFDDSLNPAIHITYRISLRSSSLPEPRDPPLRGMDIGLIICKQTILFSVNGIGFEDRKTPYLTKGETEQSQVFYVSDKLTGSLVFWIFCVNDPSAGSPTETLLRLLLPLDEQICTTSSISSSRSFH